MQYRREIETAIRHHKQIALSIDVLRACYAEAAAEVRMPASALGERVQATSDDTPVEREAARREAELAHLAEAIRVRVETVAYIRKAVAELDATQRTIVTMHYEENEPWWRIAATVCFSERHCKRLRTRALANIARSFGCPDCVLFLRRIRGILSSWG